MDSPLATDLGMTLVGFLRASSMVTYAAGQRIVVADGSSAAAAAAGLASSPPARR